MVNCELQCYILHHEPVPFFHAFKFSPALYSLMASMLSTCLLLPFAGISSLPHSRWIKLCRSVMILRDSEGYDTAA